MTTARELERQLVVRERELVALPVLLNEARMLELIRERTARTDLTGISRHYLRYKPGVSCLSGYTVSLGDSGTCEIYAKAYALGEYFRIHKAAARNVVCVGNGIGCEAFPELGLVINGFPNDTRLRRLRHMPAYQKVRKLLGDCAEPPISTEQPHCETLAYKPERRYVARIVDQGKYLGVMKLHTPERFRQIAASVRSLNCPVVSPVVSQSNHDFALIYPWTEGRILLDVIKDDPDFPSACEAAGIALARLHDSECSAVPVLTAGNLLDRAQSSATALCNLKPDLDSRLSRVMQALRTFCPSTLYRVALLHGDFHPKQVVIQPGGAVLLDTDQMALGDPAYDIANFIAHLENYVLAGAVSESRASVASKAFLDAYASVSARPQNLTCFQAIALLELAHHPFRTGLSDWPAAIDAIVARLLMLTDQLWYRNRPLAVTPLVRSATVLGSKDVQRNS